jgi:hypothetical protein
MRLAVIGLIIGLLIGGLAGYVTRPQSAEIKLPGVTIEITGKGPAHGGDAVTSGQMQHIGLFAAIGAVAGLAVGFLAGRARG